MSDLAKAASLIQAGELVAFPTETVFGLGADACNSEAVAKIFALKGRPSFNPLIVHVLDQSQAFRWAKKTPTAEKLARAFWPGPLTLVLDRAEDCPVSHLCSAGLGSLALRVPAHSDARELLEACQRPLAAPSANRSGKLSPTQAEHVRLSFGQDSPFILEGAPTSVGLESTVVDCRQDRAVLLRHGGVAVETIEALLGHSIPQQVSSDNPRSPGQLTQHYAPKSRLRLEALSLEPGEVWLGFGPGDFKPGLNLSASGDLLEAASNLFDHLHQLDALEARRIAVSPIPKIGLGLAINDRLTRAAA